MHKTLIYQQIVTYRTRVEQIMKRSLHEMIIFRAWELPAVVMSLTGTMRLVQNALTPLQSSTCMLMLFSWWHFLLVALCTWSLYCSWRILYSRLLELKLQCQHTCLIYVDSIMWCLFTTKTEKYSGQSKEKKINKHRHALRTTSYV